MTPAPQSDAPTAPAAADAPTDSPPEPPSRDRAERDDAADDRRNARRWMIVAVALIALAIGIVGVTTPSDTGAPIPAAANPAATRPGGLSGGPSKKGQPAPPFRLRSFDARTVGLPASAGRPAVVNFWASWCEPCRREMPAFDAAARAFAGRVDVVGVAVDDTDAAARQFAAKIGVAYPLAFDTTGRLKAEYGILGLPSTFFVGADGRILDVAYGEQSAAEITRRIDTLLAQPAPSGGAGSGGAPSSASAGAPAG